MMKPTTSDAFDELALAEASAWLTRLQDPGRSPAIEAAFKEWLVAHPSHAKAFARVNEVWELLPGAQAFAYQPGAGRRRAVLRPRQPWLLASACFGAALVAIAVFHLVPFGSRVYQTAPGEQRTVVLEDKTQITLNTDTKLDVDFRDNERRVVLERGEALFRVTENPERPFVVQTRDAQVVDLGTVFDVRDYSRDVAVTLLEGKVWVGTRLAKDSSASSSVLAPGERLTIQSNGDQVLDRPNENVVLAWSHGQVYFDDTTLAEAADELNRYGGSLIRFADPALGRLRVSGVFSVRDHREFASAVASLHGLKVKDRGGALLLER